MAKACHVEDVFRPKTYPTYTYVDRLSGHSTYEKKMRRAIRTPGNLVVISGASKSGKTVLLRRVISEDSMVDLSGSQIRTVEDFWQQIAEKLEIPSEVQLTESFQSTEKKQGTGKEKAETIPADQRGRSRRLYAFAAVHRERSTETVVFRTGYQRPDEQSAPGPRFCKLVDAICQQCGAAYREIVEAIAPIPGYHGMEGQHAIYIGSIPAVLP